MEENVRAVLENMCRQLQEAVSPEVLFDAKMIAHELLVNALAYGGGVEAFSFALEGEEVRITVRGKRAFCPPEHIPRADVMAEHGRGLYLVEALSCRRAYSDREGLSVFIKI